MTLYRSSFSVAFVVACLGSPIVGIAPAGIAVQPTNVAFVIERARAGFLELGEPIEDVYSSMGKERVRLVPEFPEGMFTPRLHIDLPGATVSPAIVAEIREAPCPRFSLWSLDVRDPRFRTREGLGIGSTLREIQRFYKVKIGSAEGRTYTIANETGLSFQLSTMVARDDSAVVSILVVADPVFVRKKRCPDGGV